MTMGFKTLGWLQPRGSVRTYVPWDMPISRQSDIMLSSNLYPTQFVPVSSVSC